MGATWQGAVAGAHVRVQSRESHQGKGSSWEDGEKAMDSRCVRKLKSTDLGEWRTGEKEEEGQG